MRVSFFFGLQFPLLQGGVFLPPAASPQFPFPPPSCRRSFFLRLSVRETFEGQAFRGRATGSPALTPAFSGHFCRRTLFHAAIVLARHRDHFPSPQQIFFFPGPFLSPALTDLHGRGRRPLASDSPTSLSLPPTLSPANSLPLHAVHAPIGP